MKLILLQLIVLSLLIQGCDDTRNDVENTLAVVDTRDFNNTRGYLDNGKLIREFDCPDATHLFPPIDILIWDKTPAVNDRLPTYEETMNGKAIAHYEGKHKPDVKSFPMTLPKLAYRLDPGTKSEMHLVVVTQIAQTPGDTIVGFRYLTGGCGGSLYRNFRFLNNEEASKIISTRILI